VCSNRADDAPPASEEDAVSEPAQEPTYPVLIVTGPPRDGESLHLESLGFEKVLGSGPECHMRLQAGNIDFNHARVMWEGRGVLLTDLGSAAGTYVNGEKIGTDHLLRDGDRICLGPPGSKQSVKLLARIPAESAMPAPLVLAPERDPFGLGEEPPALDLAPAAPAPAPAPAAAPAPPAPPAPAPPPPVAAAAPARAAAPVAPAGAPAGAPPAVIFDTPAPAAKSQPRRPDLMELPSIEAPPAAPDAPAREVPEKRARPAPPARGRAKAPSIPRAVWLIAAVVVLAGAGWLAYGHLRPAVPALTALAPSQAEPRQSLVITGSGFDAEPSGNTVHVGARTAVVTAASATQVTVTVPADVDSGASPDVPVTVQTRGGTSNPVFLRVRRLPRGLKLENDVALPGAEVAVVGQNLDVKPLVVRVAGIPADVTAAEAGSVRFRVPTAVPFEEGRSVPVIVQVGADSSPALPLLLGRLPLIAEVSPRSGQAGDRVTLRGRGFAPEAAGNVLTFGAEPALVLAATETELVAVVPHVQAGAGERDLPLLLKARGAPSAAGRTFAMQRPSASTFVPHFFAAPVPEDPAGGRVFVSTALGPVLLLAGRDEAPSVGERAVRAAAALNAAFSARTPLELRESPVPAVVARGSSAAAVNATSADAAASRATPRALAAHWAAVLQDMQALFVERQRPVRVVQTSPRGKVLLELYAEAERVGGAGAGVPNRLVEPLPFAVARAFREMTLTVPTQTQATTAAAAVAGTWRGTLQEDGLGERPMQLRLQMDAGRLSGAITTRAGALGMEIPVHDLAYDKGVLSFRTTSGAAARRYRGTLQGATLTGTIHAADAKDLQVGRFTLRYTE
jgi:FHA domain-containing protein/IPT/TIG domain-containing protein